MKPPHFICNVPSDTQIIFKKSDVIMPVQKKQIGINITGKPPQEFYPMIADAPKHTRSITTKADFNVGDWLEIQSDYIFTDSPNSKKARLACLRKIVDKTGDTIFTYELNAFLHDDYLIKDNSVIGKPTMIDNVTLENPIIQASEDIYFDFGIYIQYAAHVTLINPIIHMTKKPFSADRIGASAIKLKRCFDVKILNPTLSHIGWYGIELQETTENVYVESGTGFDCRHTVSVNWATTIGRPTNATFYNMIAKNNTLSSFDTHDVGNHIVFDSCRSYDAGDDGFQFRTPAVIARNCIANTSFLDGFSTQKGADNCLFEKCYGKGNGRKEFNISHSNNNRIID
jgi:hypothetical protein